MSERIGPDHERITVEEIVRGERSALLGRSRKYALVTIPLALTQIFQGERGLALQCAYYAVRNVDDICDEARPLPYELGMNDSLEYVNAAQDYLNGSPAPAGWPVASLIDYALRVGESVQEPGDDMRSDLLTVFGAIRTDSLRSRIAQAKGLPIPRDPFTRMGKPSILTEAELREYFHDSFVPTHNIVLTLSGAKLRGGDIADLAQIQGHLYSLNDLEEDMNRGIVNIPAEVLKVSSVDPSKITYAAIISDEAVRDWMNATTSYYSDLYKNLLREVWGQDKKAAAMVALLGTGLGNRTAKTVQRYAT